MKQELITALRALSIDMIEKAQSGHPGMPLGFADVAAVLWQKFLKFDPKDPTWPNRDRFILSAGHGSPLLYALLYLSGFDVSIEDLKQFRQKNSRTPGHPEYNCLPGVEATTGPLGQGLANAVGMAISEQWMNSLYGSDLIDHKIYVVVGDGCLMEGISHEALSLAGHLNLRKLIVLFDDNKMTIDGPTSLTISENIHERVRSYGWNTKSIDGHNPEEIEEALAEAQESTKPSFIACQTIIGYGSPDKQNTSLVHGAPLGEEEYIKTKDALHWPFLAFQIPDNILQQWRQYGKKGEALSFNWKKNFDLLSFDDKRSFQRRMNKKLPDQWNESLSSLKKTYMLNPKKEATRTVSESVIRTLSIALPELVGGAADLSESVKTKIPGLTPLSVDHPNGRYIHYGIREHAMAAIMNGIALYGCFIPFGGTFLTFSDYMRPAIRLSAMMNQHVIYIFSHDSIGLGEDGPTHQPVEHLASLRLIPNLCVFRPADAIEVCDCWEQAITRQGPSVLSLSRQTLDPIVRTYQSNYLIEKGGYLILAPIQKPHLTLIATGSEVSLALETAHTLEEEGYTISVASIPCLEIFQQQDISYQNEILGEAPRIIIEAGVSTSWAPYLRDNDRFCGVETFGLSAPYKEVYQHFGLTVDSLVKKAKQIL